MKQWWFCLHIRQILGELQPEANFCYSDAWFSGFKKSMRHATNTCQKELADKHSSIQHFHRSIRRTAQEGDMNQTPLPFGFSDGPMYADTGKCSVWVLLGSKMSVHSPAYHFCCTEGLQPKLVNPSQSLLHYTRA